MGLSGFIMNSFESHYLELKKKRSIRLNLMKLLGRRKRIIAKNFLMSFNELRMYRPDSKELSNRNSNIYRAPEIKSLSEECIPTLRYDDPIFYKVQGLDTP